MKWRGGKGSARRPEDVKKIDENWDKIFKKDREISELKNVAEEKQKKKTW
tara:strand:+ start:262 stop:411 length:150 start_codon:yes stop_codon:yes gene_type:complete